MKRQTLLLVVAMTGGSHALHVQGPGLSLRQHGSKQTLPSADSSADALRLSGGAGETSMSSEVGHRGKLSYAWDALGFANHLIIGQRCLPVHILAGLCGECFAVCSQQRYVPTFLLLPENRSHVQLLLQSSLRW